MPRPRSTAHRSRSGHGWAVGHLVASVRALDHLERARPALTTTSIARSSTVPARPVCRTGQLSSRLPRPTVSGTAGKRPAGRMDRGRRQAGRLGRDHLVRTRHQDHLSLAGNSADAMSTDVRAFLARPAPEVAPELLGWTLSAYSPAGVVTVELTEVEAYSGQLDPASHAWRGPTKRNAVMFGPAGHLYVYRSHGLHWCANVVTGDDGEASAVLLRAGRVVEGRELAQERRGVRAAERSLARGPGCLGQALGFTSEQYGADLIGGDAVHLTPPGAWEPSEVRSGPRVGVSRAAEVPWRFWLAGEPSVSAYRRHLGKA